MAADQRMQFPEVEIQATDSIAQAEKKVERAYEEKGGVLLAYENLNSLLPTSPYCHFFQVRLDGRECVVVVMSADWDEKSVLTILNVLLNIRLDPDPPGRPPLFRFYCAHPVPPVLATLFGDLPASDFECRAALVARFGSELQPSQSLQLAAVAMHLLRECFGVRSSFYDPRADERIARAAAEEWRGRIPEGAAPLNALIVLGFLHGEVLRARLLHESRWVRLKDAATWPVLVFGSRGDAETAPETESMEEGQQASRDPAPVSHRPAAGGSPQVIFSPIAAVIAVYNDKNVDRFLEAGRALATKCAQELGEAKPGTG
jgi:hypothetical protein